MSDCPFLDKFRGEVVIGLVPLLSKRQRGETVNAVDLSPTSERSAGSIPVAGTFN